MSPFFIMIFVKGKPQTDMILVDTEKLTRVTTLDNRILNVRCDLFPTIKQGKGYDTIIKPDKPCRWVLLDKEETKAHGIDTDENQNWMPANEVEWRYRRVPFLWELVSKNTKYVISKYDLVKYVNPYGQPLDYNNTARLLRGQTNDIMLAMKIIEKSNLYQSIGSIPLVIAENYTNIMQNAKITAKVKRMLKLLGMNVQRDGKEGIMMNYLEVIRYVRPELYNQAFNLLCNVRRS